LRHLTTKLPPFEEPASSPRKWKKRPRVTCYDFSGVINLNPKRALWLSYESFVVPLVKVMQEQQTIINSQGQKIRQLQEIIDAENKRIDQQKELIIREKQGLLNVKT